ncbi:calvin cycle protein CP12-1, chloroplastic [Solanum lycopersicum]|uniref:CP12 domain-containing protein n=1 Tax=Solanum lycopersicum TaxID=4081 RepID=A0A3Q7GNU4_SOLLC|nr:calvin cycle protein CP12-1, chloroplastic [Solanum lycopersicum]
MASIAGVSITIPTISSDSPKIQPLKLQTLNSPWKKSSQLGYRRMMYVVVPRVVPDKKLSDLVAESVKEAEETCAEDPVSGECKAAWDVVEETSAAASHARDKKKESDVLENYCKDNPETDECRTYDN